MSLNLSYSNNRIPGEDSSYVFVVTSQDVTYCFISLEHQPSSKQTRPNKHEELSPWKLTQWQQFWVERNLFWIDYVLDSIYLFILQTESQFVVPYFPYFSNCEGEGDIMYIMQMLQNKSDCNLVPID